MNTHQSQLLILITTLSLVNLSRYFELHFFQGALKCATCAWKCNRAECDILVNYNPEEDGIHMYSNKTCMGDEIGYDFLARLMKDQCTFTSFCDDMTRNYKQMGEDAAPFASRETFVQWWFSWAAAMQIDFRKDADPWCKDHPSMLVGDGTHIGVSLKHENFAAIERSDLNQQVETHHKRYDRSFIFEPEAAANMTKADLAALRTALRSSLWPTSLYRASWGAIPM